MPRVSVLMPTYDQDAFVRRAIASLQAQTMADWELIVVVDGSPDTTADHLAALPHDPRITWFELPENHGMGAALNVAMERAAAPIIAYLPSDDLFYPEHLAELLAALEADPAAILVFSGVRHHYNRYAEGQIEGHSLQLVQVAHRRTADRWRERTELVSDDLERLFFERLRARGAFVGTGRVTCEWVAHPLQMHLRIREQDGGGINPFRSHYRVPHPMRFHSSQGNRIDEVAHYRRYRERPPTPPAPDGLKILLVGELAYNADRVLALEERGHRLYGLWTDRPAWFNTVGPLPFGHVQDLPRDDWRRAALRIKPDLIYAQLNWQTVPFCHRIMRENPGIPFVWHFKEGPFICLEKGIWRELVELYEGADGQIYNSPEQRDWFETVVPGLTRSAPSTVLDGDLPKADWLAAQRSPRLSDRDGQIHTVVPGRPIGLHVHQVAALAAEGIHLHFYGDFTHGLWRSWIEKCQQQAAGFLHLHANVDQERWVAEFSQYDAGWLHIYTSHNGGDLRRADWDDLNYPARIATLAVAGLPMIQRDNGDAVIATASLSRRHEIGIFVRDMADLRAQLADETRMAMLREHVWRQRHLFTFDAHADRLVAFFREVVATASG